MSRKRTASFFSERREGGISIFNLRAFFSCLLLFIFILMGTGEAMANGNTTADAPAPPEPVKKSVIKAPIKKAAPKKKPAKKKPAPPKPVEVEQPGPSSLHQGIYLMQQERYQQARPWLQKAVQEDRRNPHAWYWYALCHEMQGKYYEAQYFYSKALALDPSFAQLSRVLVYPGDGSRVPLWDPLRPARIYTIPTNDSGIVIIPPDAPQARRYPAPPPVDPTRPKVPSYLPPEPGATPMDGDAWQPGIYVPPNEAQFLNSEPIYMPPAPMQQ